ncbi:MAG TPA: tRNA (adenosine(37)-N6)-threonylcarbamoyltransferase complex dimerization subunit type 1 TsaB [Candidatus Saccharimonadales bacterium]|jgi:tRNA threonylcarbamoyladenosine biosynthesis protein TsaB|nr:tRNA (adenosine(37)-N6)-threonylcarbamoyltransferase complex dimerization subunit type 1 TsaB [Candidatus Saccharimonadales bacterium]
MFILTVKTSDPIAEIGLFTGEGKQLGYEHWEAHRQLADTIHEKIRLLLAKQHIKLPQIGGVVCYEGPGSFTGLRIGLSVANSISYSLQIPITGSQGKNWLDKGLKSLLAEPDQKPVMPFYGAPVHITPPKK